MILSEIEIINPLWILSFLYIYTSIKLKIHTKKKASIYYFCVYINIFLSVDIDRHKKKKEINPLSTIEINYDLIKNNEQYNS